jgi:hypothetical protein
LDAFRDSITDTRTTAAASEDVKTVFGDKFRQIENTIAFFEKKLSLSLKEKS